MKIAIAAIAALAGTAAAQSSAAYTLVANPASDVLPNGIISVSVFGQATSGQIGNGSGINGVNLSVEIANGTLVGGSFAATSENFGNPNFVTDAQGFDVSLQSNSFAGNNFSAGIALFSFEVLAGGAGTVDITTSQGTISLFNAATGLPAAFTPSVAYDNVDFGSASISIVPAPGVAAVLGLGGLAAARRRRA